MESSTLILGAMDSEIDYLVSKLENCNESKLDNYSVYEGKIGKRHIIILKTDIGIINAAIATTLAIQKYAPKCIINIGTAGGYGNNRHNNDIIIGKYCMNIMSAKTPKAEIGEGSNSAKWEYVTFQKGEDKKTLECGNDELIQVISKEKYNKGNVYVGTIGSGDIWCREKDRIEFLYTHHNVLCEEMEAISIYTVANRYKVPVVAIKIISNNEYLEEEYDSTVAMKLQEYMYNILKK